MKSKSSCQEVCIHCRNYQLINRTYGNCQKLAVSVQGYWRACSFYLSPFS